MSIDSQNPAFHSKLVDVETFLENERQQRQIPGLSVAIVHDQKLLWSRGFGYADVAKTLLATPQTIYCVGSVTKTFIATMLMQLRDADKLSLDDPIVRYVPELRVRSRFADTSPITLRQVVTHLAGLPRDPWLNPLSVDGTIQFRSYTSLEKLLDHQEIELIAAPMTRWHYSNLGFALLELALGRIAGQLASRSIAERILHPLQMKCSGFGSCEDWSVRWREEMATPYLSRQGRETTLVQAPPPPAEDLCSSVIDMARFIALQFRDGPAEGEQILKGSTLHEMHTPVWLAADWKSATALSWELERCQEQTFVHKGGRVAGFEADVVFVPALKLGLALFMNTNQGAAQLNRSVLEMILPFFQERHRQDTLTLLPVQSTWQRYVGRYAGNAGSFGVMLTSDRLLCIIWGREITLMAVGGHCFSFMNGPFRGEYILFLANDAGYVTHAACAGGILFVREA